MTKLWHGKDVQISQSALESYFQCPLRLKFMSELTVKDPADALVNGLAAHALLAGESVPDASPTAVAYYESLFDLAMDNGIEIWKQEFVEEFQLEDGIWFKRVIDGIGTWQGRPVIFDWKTSAKGAWPYFRGASKKKVIPKSMSFQAVSYLIPNPDNKWKEQFKLEEWPDTFVFIVSDSTGHGELAVYEKDPEMEENFRQAARLMAHAVREGSYPAIRGGACGVKGTSWACNYIDACYKLPGWEDLYTKITPHVEEDRLEDVT